MKCYLFVAWVVLENGEQLFGNSVLDRHPPHTFTEVVEMEQSVMANLNLSAKPVILSWQVVT